MEKINENSILISVIIPVFNGEKYIEHAVKSIVNQPCKQLEIIIVNDGSDDNSANICKKLAEQNKNVFYYEKENEGIGATRNFGIRCAKGKYLSFLDQDDIWIAGFFNNNISDILKEDIDVLGFSMYVSNENLSKGRYLSVKNEDYYNGGLKTIESSWLHHSSFLFKRELIQKFNLEYPLTRHEDLIFKHKCLYVSKHVRYINVPIFIYRNNPSSETHRKYNVEKMFIPLLHSWGDLIGWHEENYVDDNETIKFCKKMRCIYSIEAIEELYKNGYSYKKVQQFYQNVCPDLLKEYVSYNFSTKNYTKIYEYEKKPILFAVKNRLKGIAFNMIKGIVRSSWVRSIYEKRKYPQIMDSRLYQNENF